MMHHSYTIFMYNCRELNHTGSQVWCRKAVCEQGIPVVSGGLIAFRSTTSSAYELVPSCYT